MDQSDQVGKIKKREMTSLEIAPGPRRFVGSISDVDHSPLAQLHEVGHLHMICCLNIESFERYLGVN